MLLHNLNFLEQATGLASCPIAEDSEEARTCVFLNARQHIHIADNSFDVSLSIDYQHAFDW
ncbi:MAG: hypothetical protein NVSMB49_21400 [Ktedonobacteraceae bacterium]